jgi:hypothetical protein
LNNTERRASLRRRKILRDRNTQFRPDFNRQPDFDAESSRFSRRNGLAAVAARDVTYDRKTEACARTARPLLPKAFEDSFAHLHQSFGKRFQFRSASGDHKGVAVGQGGPISLSISASYAMNRSFEAFEPVLGFPKS